MTAMTVPTAAPFWFRPAVPGAEVEALTLEQAKLGVRIQELESLAKLQDRELRAVRARYDELFGIALGHASLAADLMRHFAVTDEGSGEAHRG